MAPPTPASCQKSFGDPISGQRGLNHCLPNYKFRNLTTFNGFWTTGASFYPCQLCWAPQAPPPPSRPQPACGRGGWWQLGYGHLSGSPSGKRAFLLKNNLTEVGLSGSKLFFFSCQVERPDSGPARTPYLATVACFYKLGLSEPGRSRPLAEPARGVPSGA